MRPGLTVADGTRALNRSGIAQPLARVAGSTDWRAALGDVPVEAWMSRLALAQVVTPEILEVAALSCGVRGPTQYWTDLFEALARELLDPIPIPSPPTAP
ncbi:MAG: hypothetical protein J0I14_07960, partial [Propionibacteriaceae bacterium]|nr:hypothetical protein [Propionibacteriaceae bacterium]